MIHLAGLASRTEGTERNILAAAEHRLEAVRADLDKLRPRALLDEAVADRYQALILESGKLHHVAAKARAALGE